MEKNKIQVENKKVQLWCARILFAICLLVSAARISSRPVHAAGTKIIALKAGKTYNYDLKFLEVL